MIIEYDLWQKTVKAMSDYLGTSLDVTFKALPIILNERVLEVFRNIDKHIDGILKYVDPNDRTAVSRVLYHIARNIDKTLEFINNPPDWAREILISYFLSRTSAIDHNYFVDDPRLKKFMIYVPGTVCAVYNGIVSTYIVLYPSQKNVSKLKPAYSLWETYSDSLYYILSRNIIVDVENRKVKLYGFELELPLSGIVKIIREFGLPIDIHTEVIKSIADSFAGYSVENHIDYIVVNLKPMIIELKNKYNIDLNELYARIYVDYNTFLKSSTLTGSVVFYGSMRMDDGEYKFIISGQHIAKYEYVHGIRSKIENIFKIHDVIGFNHDSLRKHIEKLSEFLKSIKEQYDQFKTIVVKHGYTPSISTDENNSLGQYYSEYLYFTAQKQSKQARTRISYMIVSPAISGYDANLRIKYEIELDKTVPDLPDPALRYTIKRLREKTGRMKYINIDTDNLEYKTREYFTGESYILIDGNITISKDFNLDEFLNEIDRVMTAFNELYEEGIKTGKINEILSDIYLASYLTSKYIGYVRYDEKYLEDKVYILAKKLNIPIKSLRTLHIDASIELLKTGYIKIDNNLHIYINNKRITDLFPIFALFKPKTYEEHEKTLALELIQQYILSSNLENKPITEILSEIGITSEDATTEIIRKIASSPRALETITKTVNGKPQWSYLSNKAKEVFIENIVEEYLAKIYYNPQLRNTFSDHLNKIEAELLTRGNPSTVTRIAIEKYREQLGIPEDAEIINTDKFYGVKIGNHIIQLHSIDKNKPTFIVFDHDKKGFLIPAKTVEEAIETFEYKKERLRKILKTLERNKTNIYTKHEEGEYKYYCIVKNKKEHPIDENTIAEIKKQELKNEENNQITY